MIVRGFDLEADSMLVIRVGKIMGAVMHNNVRKENKYKGRNNKIFIFSCGVSIFRILIENFSRPESLILDDKYKKRK